mmetsp:Transcript_24100/g.59576  ORF Transcript_24100/g.59576 Transcript_24100/m.59576 type:complete len:239 (-) Transcript_24100:116-832(-)
MAIGWTTGAVRPWAPLSTSTALSSAFCLLATRSPTGGCRTSPNTSGAPWCQLTSSRRSKGWSRSSRRPSSRSSNKRKRTKPPRQKRERLTRPPQRSTSLSRAALRTTRQPAVREPRRHFWHHWPTGWRRMWLRARDSRLFTCCGETAVSSCYIWRTRMWRVSRLCLGCRREDPQRHSSSSKALLLPPSTSADKQRPRRLLPTCHQPQPSQLGQRKARRSPCRHKSSPHSRLKVRARCH